MRIDEGFAGMPAELTEVAMLPSVAARMRVSVGRVVVVENEVTYLAMPVPFQGVVVWGAGYAAGGLGRLPWVRDAEQVVYCGDLDTHGFAILSLLRGQVPQSQSLLMDQATLLAHRKRWGRESSPTRGRLENLDEAEQALYQDLVEDLHAPSLRLEQERLDWRWVEGAVATAGIAQAQSAPLPPCSAFGLRRITPEATVQLPYAWNTGGATWQQPRRDVSRSARMKRRTS